MAVTLDKEDTLRYIINNLALPPKLPTAQVDDVRTHDLKLLDFIFDAVGSYEPVNTTKLQFRVIRKAIERMKGLREEVNVQKIEDVLKHIRVDEFCPMYLEAQNAGLIISRDEDGVIFQSFEAAIPNESIMMCTNRLICTYPGPSVRVPWEVVRRDDFREQLGHFLQSLDVNVLTLAQTTTRSFGRFDPEKDPVSPLYITDFLTNLLLGFGEMEEDDRFTKRIRDEVNVASGKGQFPWRRAPIWLVIRVFLQLVLRDQNAEGPEQHLEYKCLMLHFMTQLCREISDADCDLESELLFVLNNKLARKGYKLSQYPKARQVIREAVDASNLMSADLENRWTEIQNTNTRKIRWDARKVKRNEDTKLSLETAYPYILERLAWVPLPPNRTVKVPEGPIRITEYQHYASGRVPIEGIKAFASLEGRTPFQKRLALYDFELWVELKLTSWYDDHKLPQGREDAVKQLHEAIKLYAEQAGPIYASDPERISIMALTICEMWKAMDKLALRVYPMLDEYPPEVFPALFRFLVLPRASQMERLYVMEEYLRDRRDRATQKKHPILGSHISRNSFAVRYYDSSLDMQDIRARIVQAAEMMKDVKITDLRDSKSRIRDLTTQIQQNPSCTCPNPTGRYRRKRKSSSCTRCLLLAEKEDIRIKKYEWPLPEEEEDAKAVIFELRIPETFRLWRETTYSMLAEYFTSEPLSKEKTPFNQLNGYAALEKEVGELGFLTWGSPVKPLNGNVKVLLGTDITDICFPHAGRWKLCDTKRGREVFNDELTTNHMRPMCTPQLPIGQYKSLQDYLANTTHSQNEVISIQSKCDLDLDLHEYIAYGSLRAGEKLQWLNILRELEDTNLTFSAFEVYTLVTHAASQVGKISEKSYLRDTHKDLGSDAFALELIDVLARRLKTITDNWQQRYCLLTLSCLVRRVLSIAGPRNEEVKSSCINMLKSMMETGRSWLVKVLRDMEVSTKDEDLVELQELALEIALISRLSFDVDPDHVPSLLRKTGDAAFLIQFHSIIFDFTPSAVDKIPERLRPLVAANTRLSGMLEPVLRDLIRADPQIITAGVQTIWAGLPGDADWACLDARYYEWAQSVRVIRDRPHVVHFNIVTGELLVDGYPVGRLPKVYVENATYQRLFGKKILEVFPSPTTPGGYEAKNPIEGHRVTFAMSGDDLVIRVAKDGTTLELIPNSKFHKDVPKLLEDGYFHWLNLATNVVEFRPVAKPWVSSPDNWLLHLNPERSHLKRKDVTLVDVRSGGFDAIKDVFEGFDTPRNIIATFNDDGELRVELPRYELVFILNNAKKLECRNFPGMIIASQKLGTLIGLKDLLVLQSSDSTDKSRLVLIPKGNVEARAEGHHTKVQIKTPSEQERIPFFHYWVDTFLERFEDRVFSESWLYRIYLHALTSHVLEDPFTHQTGVELALEYLKSASAFSFKEINSETELPLLRQIAALTPIRVRGKGGVQAALWNVELTAFQQDPEFLRCVEAVQAYEKERSFLFVNPSDKLKEKKKKKDQDDDNEDDGEWDPEEEARPRREKAPAKNDETLWKRALIYHNNFRRLSLDPAISAAGSDAPYTSRHFFNHSSFDKVAFVSKKIFRKDIAKHIEADLPRIFRDWKQLTPPVGLPKVQFQVRYLNEMLHTADHWLGLDAAMKKDHSHFGALFLLACLATKPDLDSHLLITLYAIGNDARLKSQKFEPGNSTYNIAGDGTDATLQRVTSIVRANLVGYYDSAESRREKPTNETQREHELACERRYHRSLGNEVARAIEYYFALKDAEVVPEPQEQWRLIRMGTLHTQITRYFNSCKANRDLLQYATSCSNRLRILAGKPSEEIEPEPLAVSGGMSEHISHPSRTLRALFSEREAPALVAPIPSRVPWRNTGEGAANSKVDVLANLLSDITLFDAGSSSPFVGAYVKDMDESLDAYRDANIKEKKYPLEALDFGPLLQTAQTDSNALSNELFRAMKPVTEADLLAVNAGLWPGNNRWFWLKHLRKSNGLGEGWEQSILAYAQSMSICRRWSRVVKLHSAGRTAELQRELENQGQQGWQADEHPDWLLFEIENNVTIREVQAQIAKQMLQPATNENSVMQLNMGEGKSSVIMPIVAAAVADGERLARVVVLKPLNTAMFQLLAEKLSSLCNRRIFYLPFSRSVAVDEKSVGKLIGLFQTCQQEGGILVASPEFILSFNLMGLDYLCRGTSSIAKPLIETQSWLQSTVRDILDESDELLSVKYQLIYTVGNQQAIDGQPDRWMTIQQVLDILRCHVDELVKACPQGFETHAEPGHVFPLIRLLHGLEDVPDVAFAREIADAIERGELPALNFRLFPPAQRAMVMSFITDVNFPVAKENALLNFLLGANVSVSTVLLLRGLFAHKLLAFCLKEKRYRVDYGLDIRLPLRTMLAVPYRAKDKPDQRADFGHPEIALTLTCLSYYYGGLSEEQLKLCFELLDKCEDPSSEYQIWIKDLYQSLPESLRRYSGVNILDQHQWQHDIYPRLRRCKSVVDFFLANHVFPREAKEFPHKLTTNSWDLAEKRTHLITGFSGTNDNRHLLPLSIQQRDSPSQHHTNALVLLNLLHDMNDHVIRARESNAETIFTSVVAQNPPVRVILDVGAQVLEMTNREVAAAWLEKDASPTIRAAIYFDDKDEAVVLMRNGTSEPLKASPMLKHMEACLAYLDEAHTRGTDLPFPPGTRALVTLGPRLAKDKLVQGCMRMRKLGQTHSVVFFCPQEIGDQIVKTKQDQSPQIRVSDILKWSMLQTCIQMEANAALWAQQGRNYIDRQASMEKFRQEGSAWSEDELADALREPESRTLEELYSPSRGNPTNDQTMHTVPWMQDYATQILSRCEQFGVPVLDASAQEEQEREVAQEEEQEREQERPAPAAPVQPSLYDDLNKFVQEGTLRPNSHSIIPAFQLFWHTTFREEAVNIAGWTDHLLCTKDFASTIVKQDKENCDDYMRPVNWVLANHDFSKIIVISPHEANELLPKIRTSTAVRLYIYAPRVTVGMRSFELFDRYSITGDPEILPNELPDEVVHELNIFAGQLYLRGPETYESLCAYLALNLTDSLASNVNVDATTGFVSRAGRSRLGMARSPFVKNPVPLIRSIMSTRRKGKPYLETHLGKLLRGRLLTQNDFNYCK